MKVKLIIAAVMAVVLAVTPAWAGREKRERAGKKIYVVTSTPSLRDFVENICGDDVKVDNLMRGPENHHAVPLKPSFLVKLSKCDILVVNGLLYEHAFIPGAMLSINRPDIDRGGVHRIECSEYIQPVEIPTKIDLALGDLHPLGSSHIHIDPGNAILMCKAIYEGMSENYPEYAEKWRPSYEDYVKKLYAELQELKEYAKGTEGLPMVNYHWGWTYLANRFNWEIAGYVEVRAGIPPTPSHIKELITRLRRHKNVVMAIEQCYSLRVPRDIASRLEGEVNIKIIHIPHETNSQPGTETYLKYIDREVKMIVDAYRELLAQGPKAELSESQLAKSVVE